MTVTAFSYVNFRGVDFIQYITGKNIEELENLCEHLDEKKFRATQIFQNIHKNKILDFSQMTNLSLDLRNKLSENYKFHLVDSRLTVESKLDSTKKYLLKMDGLDLVESVYMQYDNRKTICISSQVGCKMGCKFCASTKRGKIRDLSASEIIQQVYFLEHENGDIDNIVIMGVGEPLDNFEEIVRFIKLITHKAGRNLSHRSITLSTCGLADKIYELADTALNVNLAISLHYADDLKRKKFMPIAYKYTINEVIKACEYYFKKTKRRISYEYVVIDGVNNTEQDVENLTKLLYGKKSHINLIPLNPIEEFKYKNKNNDVLYKFKEKLVNNGLNATVRISKGLDIQASCGQLRNVYTR